MLNVTRRAARSALLATTGSAALLFAAQAAYADTAAAEPVNDFQRADLANYLGNTPAGQVPDTDLNPVLYRR